MRGRSGADHQGKRTVDGLWAYLGRALDAFEPAECRNYVRPCAALPLQMNEKWDESVSDGAAARTMVLQRAFMRKLLEWS
jgi:hypothetical protein